MAAVDVLNRLARLLTLLMLMLGSSGVLTKQILGLIKHELVVPC